MHTRSLISALFCTLIAVGVSFIASHLSGLDPNTNMLMVLIGIANLIYMKVYE